MEDGSYSMDPMAIWDHDVQFFSKQYNSPEVKKSFSLIGCRFLDEAGLAILNAPFSVEDLDDIVKHSNADKATGPHGLSMGFYKDYWPMIRVKCRMPYITSCTLGSC